MIVAGLTVGADQSTKALASASLGAQADTHRVEPMGSVFAFEYLENTGAAFGVLQGRGFVLTLAAGAIVAALIWHYLRAG